mmetsp:Transcript_34643/g.78986  ORF Transcript_34643/g.78986 Transcript_34643/m.78986 type:complete len:89 (-) Transcript_34643:302-568(-)
MRAPSHLNMLFRIPKFKALSSDYCMTDGMTCFDGSAGEDKIVITDPNGDDKWAPVYSVDTRYGGGVGMGSNGEVIGGFAGSSTPFPHA